MSIQKKQNKKFIQIRKQTNAFTYIEVIVSLLIISVLAGLLYITFSIGIKQFRSSKKSVNYLIERLDTDTIIRTGIEKVSIPFWVTEYDYSFSNNEIALSWINGIKEKTIINIPDNAVIINIEEILSEKDSIKGLIVKYTINNHVYEIKALFASRTYGDVQI